MNLVPKFLSYFLNNSNFNIIVTSILRSLKRHCLSGVPTVPVYVGLFASTLNTFPVRLFLVFKCLSLFVHPYYCWDSGYPHKIRRTYKDQVNGIYVVHSPRKTLFIKLVKILKFILIYTIISLLHVSVVNDHHQGALSALNWNYIYFKRLGKITSLYKLGDVAACRRAAHYVKLTVKKSRYRRGVAQRVLRT